MSDFPPGIRTVILVVCMAALLFTLSCQQEFAPIRSEIVAPSCEARNYHEQILSHKTKRVLKSGVATPFTNFISFLSYREISQPWIVKPFVKSPDDVWSIKSPYVENIKDIDMRTTFLIVLVDDLDGYGFEAKKYFDGRFEKILINKRCPIYIGERNGVFALATIRVGGRKESYDDYSQCNTVSTLIYFGFPQTELENYRGYLRNVTLVNKPVIEYDFEKIEEYLYSHSGC
ncbi:MAG: hypothetical protein ABJ275_08620 [Maricaulaceae bacterium]